MSRHRTVLPIWSFALAFVAVSRAEQPALTPAQARQAATEIARLVSENYVFPEKREPIASAIRTAADAGRYDTASPGELAQRITADLRKAGQDKHLWVHWDPDAYRDLLEHKDDDSGVSAFVREAGRRTNQGYRDLEILDGNVRYVRITGFAWTSDVTARVIDEAARFLGEGDAAIIDIRGNGGGSAAAVARLVSYFFPADDRILMTFHDGLSGEDAVTRVANDLPNPRMVGRPLYVLIDDGTGSAAEEFAYHVKQFKVGTLVGRTTAGAANNNARFPVAPGFVASVSAGRPIHPVSKTNWEGVGVPPDVETPPRAALDRAQLLALKDLAARAKPDERSRYEWPMVAIAARLHPVTVSERDLAAYAGKYGIRTVRLEKGALVYQREGQPAATLVPLGADLFGFPDGDDVRIRFRRAGGKVVGFDQVISDGQVIPVERTGER